MPTSTKDKRTQSEPAEKTRAMVLPSKMVSVDAILPNPHNPRRSVGKYDDLVLSIQQSGFRGSLVARPHPTEKGKFQIVAGHRRYAAARDAGITELPVEIDNTITDEGMALMAGQENLARRQLTPMEEAWWVGSIRELHKAQHGETLSVRDLRDVTGQSIGWVQFRLSLLDLPPHIQDFLQGQDREVIQAALSIKSVLKDEPDEQQWLLESLRQGTLLQEVGASSYREIDGALKRKYGKEDVAPTPTEEAPEAESTVTEEPGEMPARGEAQGAIAEPPTRPAPSPVTLPGTPTPTINLPQSPTPTSGSGEGKAPPTTPPAPSTAEPKQAAGYRERLIAWTHEGAAIMDAAKQNAGVVRESQDYLIGAAARIIRETLAVRTDTTPAIGNLARDSISAALREFLSYLNETGGGVDGDGQHYEIVNEAETEESEEEEEEEEEGDVDEVEEDEEEVPVFTEEAREPFVVS